MRQCYSRYYIMGQAQNSRKPVQLFGEVLRKFNQVMVSIEEKWSTSYDHSNCGRLKSGWYCKVCEWYMLLIDWFWRLGQGNAEISDEGRHSCQTVCETHQATGLDKISEIYENGYCGWHTTKIKSFNGRWFESLYTWEESTDRVQVRCKLID